MRVRPAPTTVLRGIAILLSPYVHDITEWKIVKALVEFEDPPREKPKSSPVPGQMLTLVEVGDRLRLSRATILRMLRRGEMRSVKLGRSIRVPESELVSLAGGRVE